MIARSGNILKTFLMRLIECNNKKVNQRLLSLLQIPPGEKRIKQFKVNLADITLPES